LVCVSAFAADLTPEQILSSQCYGCHKDGVKVGRVLEAISYEHALKMPPSAKLPDEQIAVLRKWVIDGAPKVTASARSWAFEPVRSKPEWARKSVDDFLPAKGTALDKRSWLRRVSFDLIGLPPSPAELSAFLADNSAKAYETVVERLTRFAALRRAVGSALARSGPVCRDQRP
jgi:hypothetical protein